MFQLIGHVMWKATKFELKLKLQNYEILSEQLEEAVKHWKESIPNLL